MSTAHLGAGPPKVALARPGNSIAALSMAARRVLGHAWTPSPRGFALVAGGTGMATGAWIALSRGSSLLALAPVAAALAAGIIICSRQAAAYLMLASLPFAEVSVGAGVSLVRYVLVGTLVAWFVGVSVYESPAWLKPDRTDAKVFLWLLALTTSAVVFDSQAASGLVTTYLNLALVYYVASRTIRDARQARGAVLALTVGLGSAALLALAWPSLAGSFVAAGGVQRLGPLGVSGAYGIDRFAGWLAVGSVLPWAALDGPRRPMTLVARGLSVVSLIALVATVSKAGLIGLAAGVLGWSLLSTRRCRVLRVTTTVAALGVGWLLLPAGVHTRFAQFQQPGSVANSRFAVWEAGLRMFLAHPITGVGVGNFDLFAPAYFPQGTIYTQAVAAHNIVVGAFAETGIIGAGLMLLMVGTILLEGIRLVRADRRECLAAEIPRLRAIAAPDGDYARLTTGLLVSFIMFLTVALSLDLERDRYFLVLAGMVHGLYRGRSRAAALCRLPAPESRRLHRGAGFHGRGAVFY